MQECCSCLMLGGPKPKTLRRKISIWRKEKASTQGDCSQVRGGINQTELFLITWSLYNLLIHYRFCIFYFKELMTILFGCVEAETKNSLMTTGADFFLKLKHSCKFIHATWKMPEVWQPARPVDICDRDKSCKRVPVPGIFSGDAKWRLGDCWWPVPGMPRFLFADNYAKDISHDL